MRLGKVLAYYRHANRMGVRELAKQMFVSAATLSRIENDKPCDGETLTKIMIWLFTNEASSDARRSFPLVKTKPTI
jgi:transcriptional regulator with XRE-family HTH domain